MSLVLRRDNFELRPSVRTPEGYLYCQATIAAPGILEYLQKDGRVRRELVTKETLNDKDNLGTLAHKPITKEHPKDPVDSTNVDAHGVGKVTRVSYEPAGGFVVVDMLVDRADAVSEIEQDENFRGTSPAYLVEIDETPGEHPIFGRYDAIQVKRYNNHVALTKSPRGGFDKASFRADALADLPEGGAVMVGRTWSEPDATPSDENSHSAGVTPMPQINIDGVTYEVADADTARAIMGAIKSRADEGDMGEKLKMAQEALAALRSQVSEKDDAIKALTDERDGLQGKIDQLLAGPPKDDESDEEEEENMMQGDSEEDRIEWYNERKTLEPLAERFKVDSFEKMTNAELKLAVVKAYRGDSFEPKSDAYLDGVYDALVEQMSGDDTHRTDSNSGNKTKRRTKSRPNRRDAAEALQSFEERHMNAWRSDSRQTH